MSVAIYRGNEYHGRNAVVHPVPGDVIGDARLPGCNHPGQPAIPPDEFVKVALLPGIDTNVAVVDALIPEVMYIRSDLDSLPAEVERFFTAPSCRQEDSPIELQGQWLGIIGPGEQTELDLLPPYSVEMLVARSSSPRYISAEIIIHVLPSLGSPLTHEDVETSLWQGGTLRVESTCDQERFVASSVEAFSP